jgi:chromosomal replication initiator protein
LEERLRSRFEWGLSADIQAPDFETRLAILRSKAERTGRHISDEILESVAKQIQSNIRELEGALNRIIAFADLSGSALTPGLVEVALADLLPRRRNVQPNKVIEAVAEACEGIDVDDLLGQNRTAKIAIPRQLAMYILSTIDISSPQIGELLGGRDHSTVLYGIKKVAGDEKLKRRAESILSNLLNQAVVE